MRRQENDNNLMVETLAEEKSGLERQLKAVEDDRSRLTEERCSLRKEAAIRAKKAEATSKVRTAFMGALKCCAFSQAGTMANVTRRSMRQKKSRTEKSVHCGTDLDTLLPRSSTQHAREFATDIARVLLLRGCSLAFL